jgi:hypothetical protein
VRCRDSGGCTDQGGDDDCGGFGHRECSFSKKISTRDVDEKSYTLSSFLRARLAEQEIRTLPFEWTRGYQTSFWIAMEPVFSA